MSVNLMINRPDKAETKRPTIQKSQKTQYQVLPKFTDALSRLISAVGASIPESVSSIESMIIKGDRLFIHYRTGRQPEDSALVNDQSICSEDACILKIGDGGLLEQLQSIYQIKTSPDQG
jgi:hypothetical protein